MIFPRTITIAPLAGGDAGTYQTLDRIRELVQQAQGSPAVRAAVIEALRGAREKDQADEVSTLLEFVRSHLRYTRDPVEIELVQAPDYLLEQIRMDGFAYGDCDDASVLFAALAETAGYPTRFVVQGPDSGDFTHVVTEVLVRGAWMPADPSQGQAFGWKPHRNVEREETEMRPVGIGNGSDIWGTLEYQPPEPELRAMPVVPETGTMPTNGGFLSSFGDFLSGLATSAAEVAQVAIPLAERYGALKPVTGYTPAGQPIYATTTLPAGGTKGAVYQQATQPLLFGLSPVQLIVIAGIGFVFIWAVQRR